MTLLGMMLPVSGFRPAELNFHLTIFTPFARRQISDKVTNTSKAAEFGMKQRRSK